MASRTKYITRTLGAGGIIALITWFFLSTNFDVEIDLNDKVCAGDFKELCEANFNITAIKYTYYLYNKASVELNFIPDVKASYICKKDGRFRSSKRLDREKYPCGVGFREFDFKSPLTSRYKYVEKFTKGKKHEYKLVVFKHNPSDEIKWGGKITGESFDPIFLPSGLKPIIKCDIIIRTEYDTCRDTVITYYNYTFINNVSNINVSMQDITPNIITYSCNPRKVSFKENCRTVGFNTTDLIASCPERYRCDIIGTQLCYVNLDDGDVNFNFKQAGGRGWDGACVAGADLREGPLKISEYKDIYMDIKRR